MDSKFWNFIGIVAVVTAIVWAYFYTKEKVVMAGIQLENMDMTVKPGDDFYTYANGGWQKKNPIPDDYARFGAFEVLRNTNLERTREVAENDTGKIGTLYKIAMDEKKLNADGVKPVTPQLAEIDSLTRENLEEYMGRAIVH